ncbi:hypothetical protein NQ317_008854 [Molorchus minor]|uniref:RRM domain-containing protein n=1 Tax=Molorchus minor TaxID=1323400 RepID=A0ABQ9IS92_9CUCU|nr:hypothetical protein NQ317_008854 [Molorchus minor]
MHHQHQLPLPVFETTLSWYVDDSKPPDRTLFVLNVPPYSTEDGLKSCFSIAGKVKSVTLQREDQEDQNDGFKRAYIVFDKRESMLRALKLKSLNPLSTSQVPIKNGIVKWVEQYNCSICDPAELQNKINEFMTRYDKEEEKRKLQGKKDITDDEGWTLVTKKGRNPGLARKESVGEKINEKIKKSSKKKELKNFYTFQIRGI